MIAIGAGITALMIGVIVLIQYPQGQQGSEPTVAVQELRIGLDNVHVISKDDTTVTVEVTFSVLNPTRGTIILEYIKYTLYADGTRLAESMIGESLEGIVAGSGKTNYILPNTTLLLKDAMKITKSRGLEGIWDTLEGDVRWKVNGTYSVTGWAEKQFDAAI